MRTQLFKHIYYRLPITLRLLVTVFLIMMLFGTVIHIVEPKEFPTVFDGVWWAFVTGATVGYGDYVPLTVHGRIIGILLILSGGGLLTFYIATLSTSTFKQKNDLSRGKVTYKGKNHIVIVGWNERARKLVDLIISKNKFAEIVLIDSTLRHLSYDHTPFHFISGEASVDETLLKANIDAAKFVLITADTSKTEKISDRHTVLTTVAIRGNNTAVYLLAEVLTNQVENTKRAGATSIVQPNDLISSLLYQELFSTEKFSPVEMIDTLLKNQQIQRQKLPANLEGLSFGKVAYRYFNNHQVLLGVKRNNVWEINPETDTELQSGDILGVLSARDE
ncbi:potassium channel family protein [Virgibacillus sp. DJP39]|uniref:potassium channel family protein n=1 Tax=Virgibacillus sp. DJP39 TaxID=3409790 RepID=UPI003BB73268